VVTIPPFTMGGVRFVVAGGLLLLWLLLRGMKLPPMRDALTTAAPGLMMLTISNGLINWSEIHMASNIVSVLVIMSPLALVGFSKMAGEHIPGSTWAGLAVALAGGVVLFSHDLLDALRGMTAPTAPGSPPQILVALVVMTAASVWAGGSVIAARHKVEMPMQMRIALQMLAGGIGQLAVAACVGEFSRLGTPSTTSILATVYLIVVGSWIGFGCYVYTLRVFKPDTVSLVTYVNTVVAVFLGWAIGGEKMGVEMIAGSAIILAGIAIVNKGLRAKKAA